MLSRRSLSQKHPWRRRGVGGRKARPGGGPTHPAANDRRRTSPHVEGLNPRAPVGSRRNAAASGTIHHREAGSHDG